MLFNACHWLLKSRLELPTRGETVSAETRGVVSFSGGTWLPLVVAPLATSGVGNGSGLDDQTLGG